MGKIINGSEIINYTVDINRKYSQVLEERDGSGNLIVSYVYGDDLISQNRNSQISYYHYDGRGSTRALTNSRGEITDTYTYDAFGVEISRTGTTINDYLYTGQEYDANLGFYYLRARYMNPETGRFINMDTYWGSNYDPTSLHKYLYAHANPVMNYDPTGNFTLGTILLAITISSILAGIVSGIFSYIRTGDLGGAFLDGLKSAGLSFVISLLLLKFPALLPILIIFSIGSLIYQISTGQFDDLSGAELVTHLIVQTIFWLAFKAYVPQPSSEMVDVTRWGRPGLESGDWIMLGGKTKWNYFWSFKRQKGLGNQFADMSTGVTYPVPKNTIQWPTGFGFDGWWKGLFGQRVFTPVGGYPSTIFDVLFGGGLTSPFVDDFIWSDDDSDDSKED